ncbi:MAG: hypothetical protein ACRD19_05085, partial [Terriglobia bacterium]
MKTVAQTKTFRLCRWVVRLLLLSGSAVLLCGHLALAGDASEANDEAGLQQLREQITQLRREQKREQKRAEVQAAVLQQLQTRLEQLRIKANARDSILQAATRQSANAAAQSGESAQANEIPPQEFQSAIDRYLGQHQFTFAGAAAGDFIYNRTPSRNTFSLLFEPIALYRLNDWILFEGTIEGSLPSGGAADFELPVATAQFFLNDYMELNAGIFDQPFGDWYEDQSPVWVNRLITAPLLYGAEPLVPPTDIGAQLRGSVQWGLLGQDVDYTTWIANGPSFDSSIPKPVIGQSLNGQNNIALSTNGRAYGTRIRFYPLPLDAGLGRLELGASTYDGKWQNSLWFNAWGVDFAYLRGDVQARGEFVQSYRQMPAGSGPDNRQGWYLQIGYFLQDLPATGLSERFD